MIRFYMLACLLSTVNLTYAMDSRVVDKKILTTLCLQLTSSQDPMEILQTNEYSSDMLVPDYENYTHLFKIDAEIQDWSVNLYVFVDTVHKRIKLQFIHGKTVLCEKVTNYGSSSVEVKKYIEKFPNNYSLWNCLINSLLKGKSYSYRGKYHTLTNE